MAERDLVTRDRPVAFNFLLKCKSSSVEGRMFHGIAPRCVLQKMFYKTLAALNFSFHSAFNLINGPSPALLGLQQWSCNSKMSQINPLVSSTGIQTHDFSNMSLLP